MEELSKNQNLNCEKCYQIRCKKCGWEPNDNQLLKIQIGIITFCPDCGWTP